MRIFYKQYLCDCKNIRTIKVMLQEDNREPEKIIDELEKESTICGRCKNKLDFKDLTFIWEE